jgi:oxygen-independent coproporphyrinogen-3 oxidase
MRCGFCNLFTTANPKASFEAAYLEALRRQAVRVRAALGPTSFARVAVGGGTPTYLDLAGLQALFEIAEQVFGIDLASIPVSVETSPLTAEADKLRLLRECGVDRISLGVQSFIEAEVMAVGRSQKTGVVEQALDRIRAAGFPTLNLDLIYGLPGQTVESWTASLRSALRFAPEEVYLYPLYVRPLTGLGRAGRCWADSRLALYRAGRSLLFDAGYTQVSLRMFQARRAPAPGGPAYCCQDDGMVGLGCGARSYTRGLHYSSEYAVGAGGIRGILSDYVEKPTEAFDVADYGFKLGPEEQRRRYLIQSVLQADGLSRCAYRERFGADALDDLPELSELIRRGLATCDDWRIRLTEAGLERSDAIGPWLYSNEVRARMGSYEFR